MYNTISPRWASKYLLNKLLHVKKTVYVTQISTFNFTFFLPQTLQGQKNHRVGAAVTDNGRLLSQRPMVIIGKKKVAPTHLNKKGFTPTHLNASYRCE